MNEFEIYASIDLRNKIIYDIGANIGKMSFEFLRLGAKHIYAFEPSPNNFLELLNNSLSFPITCYEVALHEKNYECKTQFKDCRTDYIDEYGKKQDTVQDIKYIVLENFIQQNNIPFPDFIKMDIEGMESVVLKTFDFLFFKKIPMYIEIHAQPKDLDNQNYKDNPHWIYPQDGGFDFNKLKDYKYNIQKTNGEIIPFEDNWNPKPKTHEGWLIK